MHWIRYVVNTVRLHAHVTAVTIHHFGFHERWEFFDQLSDDNFSWLCSMELLLLSYSSSILCLLLPPPLLLQLLNRNRKVHHRVHKSPPIGPYPEPLKSSPHLQTILMKTICSSLLTYHVCLHLESGLFPRTFPASLC
jgi:hypothetical protein